MSDRVRAHVLVEGRVQGVYFRSYTQDAAESNSVCGWVRNLYDGRVEAVFEGEKESIEKVINWCRHGPPGAHVTDVSVTWQPYTGEFPSFAIRYAS